MSGGSSRTRWPSTAGRGMWRGWGPPPWGVRVPPSRRALREFFGSWRATLPQARKYPVAVRDYVMAKLTYLSGVRATELCGVRVGDVHWELGQWGRFVVRGKAARGSGPRERE